LLIKLLIYKKPFVELTWRKMIKINKLQLAWAFITDSDCENY